MLKLDHFSHDHPLILDRMENMGETCNACLNPVPDCGFICSECGFLLHIHCAELPRETQHPFLHPQHTYKLKIPESTSESFQCSLCTKTHHGFVYRCTACLYNADIDVNCFCKDANISTTQQIPPLKSRKLDHFSHEHDLVLRYISGLCSEDDKHCSMCEQSVLGATYSCPRPECSNFFIHKSCAMFQNKILHPLHRHHHLQLLNQSPYSSGLLFCAKCEKQIGDSKFVFHCSICKFDLDLACFSETYSVKRDEQVRTICLSSLKTCLNST